MVGAVSPPRRFTRAEVGVHAAFALAVLACITTGLVLYFAPLAQLVGRRDLVATIHLWAGLVTPVPLALGLLSGAFRADVHRLEQFSDADYRWLRSSHRRELAVDRFNAGQKLNAAFVVAATLLLFATGVIMAGLLVNASDDIRTGATFVHDWAALGVLAAVLGHVYFFAKYRRGDAGALPA